tara:strand:- start:87 stop:392 length:306 start_codon:yes stop_codon:yes gene_type:complete
MALSKKNQNTLGIAVVLAVFGGLIYSASEKKQSDLVISIMEKESAVLPIILPVAETQLPPLTNEVSVSTVLNADWEGLQPDGIPLLEIAPLEDVDLPPLVS